MSSLGSLIKGARKKKKLSREEISRAIKIKVEFLEMIENEDWSSFSLDPITVRGFVKNYAEFLELGQERILALFKRDFPLAIKPKRRNERVFSWTPQTTTILAVTLFALALAAYLLWQYLSLKNTPYL